MDNQIKQQIESLSHELIPVDNQQEVNFDALFKVIVIGDTGVGKSCILNRLIEGTFTEDHNVTIGVEFGNYVMRINQKHVIQLQIWDTAGQESFRNITRIFYKGSHAVILVYDITNQESFENVRRWKTEIENHADRDVVCYLIGNRCDLGDSEEREVTMKDGQELMQELSLDNHMETSALTGYNIDEMFLTISKHLYIENSSKLDNFRDDGTYNDQRTDSFNIK